MSQIHGPGLSIRPVENLSQGLADAYDAGLTKAGMRTGIELSAAH